MTNFTWAWMNTPQANKIFGTPLHAPTDKKFAFIHTIDELCESTIRFTASVRPGNLPPQEISTIYPTNNQFTSKRLVLKRILRIFKLKETKMKKQEFNKINRFILTSAIALSSGITLSSHASVVINEIDYDQPGTDTAEFIELYNAGSSAVSLDDFTIELINGNNALSYRTINLSSFNIDANAYFVVCGDASLVANCDYSFTTTTSWMQNGAPDGVGLYENGSLLDSLSYEGVLFPLTEGDQLLVIDNAIDNFSISRIANGIDTNNNADDFQLGCITPGTINIAGTGDCSAESISAVPVPAAAWLFGSGLLGLIGIARKRQR